MVEDGSETNVRLVSLFMHLVSTCCTRFIAIMADVLTDVLYSMGGLTCYWRIHGNE